jgi:hypothetical protein
MSKQCRGLRLIRHPYVTTGRTNPNASMLSADIIDQVEERLGNASRGVPLQPLLHVYGRPALVEGRAQRRRAEAIDASTAS